MPQPTRSKKEGRGARTLRGVTDEKLLLLLLFNELSTSILCKDEAGSSLILQTRSLSEETELSSSAPVTGSDATYPSEGRTHVVATFGSVERSMGSNDKPDHRGKALLFDPGRHKS